MDCFLPQAIFIGALTQCLSNSNTIAKISINNIWLPGAAPVNFVVLALAACDLFPPVDAVAIKY